MIRPGGALAVTVPSGKYRPVYQESTDFQAFFQAVSVGQGEADATAGQLVSVNPALCQMLGYSAEELLSGMTFLELTYEPDREANLNQHRQLLSGEIDNYTIEKRYVRKDGTLLWARLWAAMVNTGSEQPRRVAAVISDMTQQKWAEQRLRLAQEIGQIGTWDWDICANRATCSDSYYALYGLSPKMSLPSYEDWNSCIHPDDRARATEAIRHALERRAAGGHYFDEFRVIWPDGTIRWLAARGIFERDANGNPARMFGANIDITAQKEREQHLVMLRQELAHRVANSLAIVASMVRMERRLSQSETGAAALDSLAQRISAISLVQRKLELSADYSEVEVDALLTDLCRDLRDAFFNDGRRSLSVRASSGVRLNHNVAVSLGLIVTELVLNALKHAHSEDGHGNVCVQFQRDSSGYILTVGDDGAGLPADFRLETSGGMGMNIVRSQVRSIGGRLTVDAAPPGVRFIVQVDGAESQYKG
jgi:PAS domain S-box-containing protein